MKSVLAALVLACSAFAVLASSGCPGEGEGEGEGDGDGPPTLSSIHDDIFHIGCSASVCHGGPGPSEGLDLDSHPFETLVNVDSALVPGMKRVVPGDADNSELVQVLLQANFHGIPQMPQGGDPLPPAAIARIKLWINNGAENN
ncbi:MAG TPA: hypothetical protein VGO62_18075 [Myxococcota bacterium]|jgi:hypothetical protein